MKKISRRKFVQNAGLVSSSFFIVPRHVLGGVGYQAPSDLLNIAGIGVGGKGRVDVREVSDQNIVALCDVDQNRAAKTFQLHPKAKQYSDYRIMLEEMDDQIDAVTVSTADHTHAVISMKAIEMGKHLFLQKPLTRTIHETRMITEAAKRKNIATQMGNQGHANEGPRILNEMIWSGMIGKVNRAHVWTNRPIWPQGIEEKPSENPQIPEYLDWDLWLGPAPDRNYHPAYVPFKWRGWWDFGCGALGDMGCHLIDFPFWALKLGQPHTVEASSTPVYEQTAPVGSVVHYYFDANDAQPPVHLTWYDGGILPPKPKGLQRYTIDNHIGGVYFEGEDGIIVYRYVEDRPVLIKDGKEVDYKLPEQQMERSPGHYQEWIDACKGGKPAMANFDYSGPLTEVVLLGNVAIRSGKKLHWDPVNMKITNEPEANRFLKENYRKGWSL